MAINTSKAIWDFGVQAETNLATGDLNIYENEEAINNAIKTFFMTNEGEILNNPYNGGALLPYVFRLMNVDTYRELLFFIKTKVLSEFSPAVKLIDIKLSPNFDQRKWDIAITYEIAQFNITKTVTFELGRVHIKTAKEDIKNVALTGRTLYNFILAYLYDLYGVSLKWNGTAYQWGDKFKFTALTTEDEYYDRIVEVINSNRETSVATNIYAVAYIRNGSAKLSTDLTYLNPVTNYTMSVVLDGVPQTVSFSGAAAEHVDDLIAAIQACLTNISVTLSTGTSAEPAGLKIVFMATDLSYRAIRLTRGNLIDALYGGGASI